MRCTKAASMLPVVRLCRLFAPNSTHGPCSGVAATARDFAHRPPSHVPTTLESLWKAVEVTAHRAEARTDETARLSDRVTAGAERAAALQQDLEQVLNEEGGLREMLAAQALANVVAQRQVHDLTLEMAVARQQLTAKRVADGGEYRQLMDDGAWQSLAAVRAREEASITTLTQRLTVAQASAAKQLGDLEAQLECRRVHAAHAAALAAAAERDVADILSQIVELSADMQDAEAEAVSRAHDSLAAVEVEQAAASAAAHLLDTLQALGVPPQLVDGGGARLSLCSVGGAGGSIAGGAGGLVLQLSKSTAELVALLTTGQAIGDVQEVASTAAAVAAVAPNVARRRSSYLLAATSDEPSVYLQQQQQQGVAGSGATVPFLDSIVSQPSTGLSQEQVTAALLLSRDPSSWEVPGGGSTGTQDDKRSVRSSALHAASRHLAPLVPSMHHHHHSHNPSRAPSVSAPATARSMPGGGDDDVGNDEVEGGQKEEVEVEVEGSVDMDVEDEAATFGIFVHNYQPVPNLEKLELDVDGVNALPGPMRAAYLRQLSTHFAHLGALTAQLRATLLATADFNRSLDLWECQDWVNQRTAELLDALGARLLVCDPGNGLFRAMVMSQDGHRHEARLRAAPGLTTDVLRGGPGAYAVHRHLDADIAASLPDVDHYANYPVRSLLVGCVPAPSDPSRVLAVLQVFNKAHDAPFSAADILSFKYILEQAGVALENALAYVELQRQAAMLVKLQDLTIAMYGATEQSALTGVLATQGKKLLHAHRLQMTVLELPMTRAVAAGLSPCPSPRHSSDNGAGPTDMAHGMLGAADLARASELAEAVAAHALLARSRRSSARTTAEGAAVEVAAGWGTAAHSTVRRFAGVASMQQGSNAGTTRSGATTTAPSGAATARTAGGGGDVVKGSGGGDAGAGGQGGAWHGGLPHAVSTKHAVFADDVAGGEGANQGDKEDVAAPTRPAILLQSVSLMKDSSSSRPQSAQTEDTGAGAGSGGGGPHSARLARLKLPGAAGGDGTSGGAATLPPGEPVSSRAHTRRTSIEAVVDLARPALVFKRTKGMMDPRQRRSSMSAYSSYQQVVPMTPLVREALRRGTPIMLPDAHADPRFDKDADTRSRFRSLRVMAIPIFAPSGHALLGALLVTRGWAVGMEPDEVWRDSGCDVFSPEDAAAGVLLAQQVAVGLEAVELHSRASRLPQLLQDVPSELGLGEAVARVVGAAMQGVACEDVRVVMLSGASSTGTGAASGQAGGFQAECRRFYDATRSDVEDARSHVLFPVVGLMGLLFSRGVTARAYRSAPDALPTVYLSERPGTPVAVPPGIEPGLPEPPNLPPAWTSLLLVPIVIPQPANSTSGGAGRGASPPRGAGSPMHDARTFPPPANCRGGPAPGAFSTQAHGTVVGVIQLVNRQHRQDGFDAGDEALMRGVASQASVLLTTALAQSELVAVRQCLSAQLTFVGQLHETWGRPGVLPEATSQFSSWLSQQLVELLRSGGSDGAGVLWLEHGSGRLVGYDAVSGGFQYLDSESDWGAAYNALEPNCMSGTGGAEGARSAWGQHQPRASHPLQLQPPHATRPYLEASAMTSATTVYMPLVSSLATPPPVRLLGGTGMNGGAAGGALHMPTSSTVTTYPRQYYGVLYVRRAAPEDDVLMPEFSDAEMGLLAAVARHTALLLDGCEGLAVVLAGRGRA